MKSSPLIHSIILVVSLFLLGCSNNTESEKEKANNVIYKLIEADNRSDIKTVLNSYTDSVEFYPAGREFTKGIKNVQSNYEKLFKENKLILTTKILKTEIFGNTAVITGINRGTRKSITDTASAQINDKYIAFLVRNNHGEWKVDKLIWGLNH